MRILYATSINLPSPLANRIQILSMAETFNFLLGDNFLLGIGKNESNFKINCNYIETGSKARSYLLALTYVKYAHKNNIKVIYCREEKLLFFMILYNYILGYKISFFYELHHFEHLNKWWYRGVLKKIKGIISITNNMKIRLMEIGINENKIMVAPDAVDEKLFANSLKKEEARIVLGLPQNKKIIMYTGNVTEEWKGAGLFCECAKQFQEEYLFVVVGGKPHHLLEFKQNHPPRENLIMVGQKDHKEIPKYLWSADVLVLPNSGVEEISNISTSPMKLFEYMASGVPIVSSDIPSLREILSNANSVLVKPNDKTSLINGINIALSNRELADKISKQAIEDVQFYTWKKRTEKIIKFIEK